MLDKFPSIMPAVELQLFINCFHGFIEMSVVSPTSRFANGRFANVSSQFANV